MVLRQRRQHASRSGQRAVEAREALRGHLGAGPPRGPPGEPGAAAGPPLSTWGCDPLAVLGDVRAPAGALALGARVREWAERRARPGAAERWAAEAPDPDLLRALIRECGLRFDGLGLEGMVAMMEVARCDPSLSLGLFVHAAAASMIAKVGLPAQRERWLPGMGRGELLGCFALTEPARGSDASSLEACAEPSASAGGGGGGGGGFRLSGVKRWIGNADVADVGVVMARNGGTGQVNGFVVDLRSARAAGAWGTRRMETKIGMRGINNCEVDLGGAVVSGEDRLPFDDFRRVTEVLSDSRLLVGFQAAGIAFGALDAASRYVLGREQFGAPLAATQLTQEKLARATGDAHAMLLQAWRGALLLEQGRLGAAEASLVKMWVTRQGRQCVALARELVGGNGMLADSHVGMCFADMEAAFTYEGAYDINALIAGRQATGLAAFKPRAGAGSGDRQPA